MSSSDSSVAPGSGAQARSYRDDLVIANRVLAARGVLDGFGHVSARDPERADRFVIARSMAPALVTLSDLMELDLDGNPVTPDAPRPYLERFIHGAIYRSRPDVMAVVHHHAPSVIPFGATGVRLRPIYHMSGFLGAGVPVFDNQAEVGDSDMLIRTPELGTAHARCLGGCAATLMRGHGATVVGASLQQVVYRAIYMELNARLQADAMRLGEVKYLTEEEARLAAVTNDGQLQRPWELWAKEVTEGRD
jgi:HCOMODA/2-hydroxy-3-carboxy-muconic semialdehyde decarboxylase